MLILQSDIRILFEVCLSLLVCFDLWWWLWCWGL